MVRASGHMCWQRAPHDALRLLYLLAFVLTAHDLGPMRLTRARCAVRSCPTGCVLFLESGGSVSTSVSQTQTPRTPLKKKKKNTRS